MVYFIQNTNTKAIKIGYSRDPVKRISSIQTATADPLEILGTIHGDRRLERQLHDRLSAYRLRGEWFKGETDLANGIRAILDACDGRHNVWDTVEQREYSDFGLVGLYAMTISDSLTSKIVAVDWTPDDRLFLTFADNRRRNADSCVLRSLWLNPIADYEGSPYGIRQGLRNLVTIQGYARPVDMTSEEFDGILRDATNLINSRVGKFFTERTVSP